ncbi:hypothetical protein BGX33_009538, partial [Mortierella sp. NVP41]
KPPSQLKLSFKGMECMKGHEGYCQNCYLDKKCKWTIGFGFLQKSQASCAKLAPMSISQANSLFDQKITEYEGYVKKYIKVNLTQGQYDALVDMAYNMGPKFSKSDTVNFVNKQQFSQAIARLRSVTGDEGPRRRHEADLFESNYSKCPNSMDIHPLTLPEIVLTIGKSIPLWVTEYQKKESALMLKPKDLIAENTRGICGGEEGPGTMQAIQAVGDELESLILVGFPFAEDDGLDDFSDDLDFGYDLEKEDWEEGKWKDSREKDLMIVLILHRRILQTGAID